VAPTEGWGSLIAVPFQRDGCAHGAQPREVEVDAPEPDRVTTRQRKPHLAAARQDGAQQKHRGTHPTDERRIDLGPVDGVRANGEGEA
jgi:hypothetical protein